MPPLNTTVRVLNSRKWSEDSGRFPEGTSDPRPLRRPVSLGSSRGTRLAFLLAVMEVEKVLNAELSRLVFLADVAARRIVAKRSWWRGAVDVVRKVVRSCR